MMLFIRLHVEIVHRMLLRFTSCALNGPPLGIQDQSQKVKVGLNTVQMQTSLLFGIPPTFILRSLAARGTAHVYRSSDRWQMRCDCLLGVEHYGLDFAPLLDLSFADFTLAEWGRSVRHTASLWPQMVGLFSDNKKMYKDRIWMWNIICKALLGHGSCTRTFRWVCASNFSMLLSLQSPVLQRVTEHYTQGMREGTTLKCEKCCVA